MSERLIEGIKTPKVNIGHECSKTSQQPILESDRFCDIKRRYELSGRNFADKTFVAEQISNLVKDSLYFSGTGKGNGARLLRADTIANNPTTNCFGHAFVVSELLNELDISHYISYVNQHVFVSLEDNGKKFMVDPLSFTGGGDGRSVWSKYKRSAKGLR